MINEFGDGISWETHVDQVAEEKVVYYQDVAGCALLHKIKEHKDSGKLLDCGCHVGRWSDLFTKAGFEYTGVDQSEKAIATARKNKPDYNFVHTMLWDMNFKEEFDVATLVAVLQHNLLAEQERIVPKVYDALKHGGIMFMAESTMDKNTITQRTQQDWIRMVESCGFKFVEVFDRNDLGFEDKYIFIKE